MFAPWYCSIFIASQYCSIFSASHYPIFYNGFSNINIYVNRLSIKVRLFNVCITSLGCGKNASLIWIWNNKFLNSLSIFKLKLLAVDPENEFFFKSETYELIILVFC